MISLRQCQDLAFFLKLILFLLPMKAEETVVKSCPGPGRHTAALSDIITICKTTAKCTTGLNRVGQQHRSGGPHMVSAPLHWFCE